jgi:hypothetical protein
MWQIRVVIWSDLTRDLRIVKETDLRIVKETSEDLRIVKKLKTSEVLWAPGSGSFLQQAKEFTKKL